MDDQTRRRRDRIEELYDLMCDLVEEHDAEDGWIGKPQDGIVEVGMQFAIPPEVDDA